MTGQRSLAPKAAEGAMQPQESRRFSAPRTTNEHGARGRGLLDALGRAAEQACRSIWLLFQLFWDSELPVDRGLGSGSGAFSFFNIILAHGQKD